jgi:D-3-phosphoglycerate dehydrogenase
MFGREVADVAMSYVAALARETFRIDREVREGAWPKPRGISLADRTMALVGLGDIGMNVARRAVAADMRVVAYDPAMVEVNTPGVALARWPERIEEADFVVLTCALTSANRHIIGSATLARMKAGVRIVNVARGPLIDEAALAWAMESGQVHSVGLDVFEEEPLPASSPLRAFPRAIFGSHNSSNTHDAVVRASETALGILFSYLGMVPA